jgi:FkbM family methyltransferase
MGILRGFADHYNVFGIRGVLAVSACRLMGHPAAITAHPPGVRHAITIRLRTTDGSVYRDILLRGEYGNFDLPFTPKTIVDAGANTGMASIYYTHRYPNARIISIEAEASNFEILRRNVAKYPNVTPIHAALWNRDGFINVSEPDPATGAFGKWGFVTSEAPGSQVRAITMRTLMTEREIDSIDLLKLDIEGAEKEVFESCDWMDHIRALVVELHDRFKPGCSAAVAARTSGYSRSERGELTLYVRTTLSDRDPLRTANAT